MKQEKQKIGKHISQAEAPFDRHRRVTQSKGSKNIKCTLPPRSRCLVAQRYAPKAVGEALVVIRSRSELGVIPPNLPNLYLKVSLLEASNTYLGMCFHRDAILWMRDSSKALGLGQEISFLSPSKVFKAPAYKNLVCKLS